MLKDYQYLLHEQGYAVPLAVIQAIVDRFGMTTIDADNLSIMVAQVQDYKVLPEKESFTQDFTPFSKVPLIDEQNTDNSSNNLEQLEAMMIAQIENEAQQTMELLANQPYWYVEKIRKELDARKKLSPLEASKFQKIIEKEITVCDFIKEERQFSRNLIYLAIGIAAVFSVIFSYSSQRFFYEQSIEQIKSQPGGLSEIGLGDSQKKRN